MVGMELFVVQRYDAGEEAAAGDQARLLLQRLQERARARQRQNEQQESSAEPGRDGGEPSSAEEKVRKRRPVEGAAGGEAPRKRRKGLGTGGEKSSGNACPGIGGQAQRAAVESESDLQSCLDSRGPAVDDEESGSEIRATESQGGEELALNLKPTPPSSMMVLGGYNRKAVQQVQPFLPQWLAQPNLVQRRIRENLIPLQDVPEIHPRLTKKLQANGIESLFPVQVEVIPAILESVSGGFLTGRGGYQPSDICVSAPTGSGKTLAFVIPVVQALLERVVCNVWALAVLPTKELAQQVTKVFNIYTDGTGLKVVQLTGQKSFAKEQESLVEKTLTGFRSLADIVVATPGRLVDHLQQTPQFSLRELRFLIIDEADRMIDSMQQDWLRQVVKAVYRAEEGSGPAGLFRRAGQGPLTAARASCPQIPLQKLLFSATLTRNPEKLQQLDLYRPRLFTAAASSEKQADAAGEQQAGEKKYALPEGLSQYYVPCSLASKPLFLLHFLLRLKFTRVLCFTNSRETSHRLFLLVRAFGGLTVAEFSSRLSPSKRKRTLKEFEQGKIQLLISTDATARGIDIAGVKCIISYDAPQFIRTYIHRVGRTARGGKAGLAFTMLLKQQEHRFLKMLKQAGLPELEQQLVRNEHIRALLPQYEEALSELQDIVKEEHARQRS
ncbi:ATP-dependent RNA helicase DDX51 [Hemicordylus capensis]|uniref:ATP-dependent RNA helicase DDX51 n=1 Tax=Hemicordylus capensis TaxID=884348 RepID=UPI0023024EAE|nr:ATP-dependent RNA helicase DDX51 [Hemicordylus capensis]